MSDRNVSRSPKQIGDTSKKPWVAPRVAKIDAGQAETFTRTTADGPFSTS